MSKEEKMASEAEEQEMKTETAEELQDEATSSEESQEQEQESAEDKSEESSAQDNDYKDRYLRLYAEFENYRKRTSRERLELFASANQELMTALLPVLDDFDRAERNLPDDEKAKAYVEGLTLIREKFHKTLVNKGLKSLEVEVGQEFDVDRMEAITKIPAPSDELKGKVVDVIEQGFKLGEKVIRYARVVVGE